MGCSMRNNPIWLRAIAIVCGEDREIRIASDQVAAVVEIDPKLSRVILKTGQEFTVKWPFGSLIGMVG